MPTSSHRRTPILARAFKVAEKGAVGILRCEDGQVYCVLDIINLGPASDVPSLDEAHGQSVQTVGLGTGRHE